MINKDTWERLTDEKVKGTTERYIRVDKDDILSAYDIVDEENQDVVEMIINRLAELEDKIENGTLLELPCKVGDKVWWINGYIPTPRIEEYEVSTITIGKDNKIYLGIGYNFLTFKIDEVYYTKAQVEARLKEL